MLKNRTIKFGTFTPDRNHKKISRTDFSREFAEERY
jgi:hypothetical protein